MGRFTKYFLFLAIAGLIAAPSVYAQGKSGKQKVDLLHNGHVISVAPEAVPAHLAHGDDYATPPPVASYTVSVTTIINLFGTLDEITYTQTVTAGGSCTFPNIFGPLTLTGSSYTGDATFTPSGTDLLVTNVQSDASATLTFSFLF